MPYEKRNKMLNQRMNKLTINRRWIKTDNKIRNQEYRSVNANEMVTLNTRRC